MGMIVDGPTPLESQLARIEALLERLVEAVEVVAASQNAEYGFRR